MSNSVYIGVVGSQQCDGLAMLSILNIHRPEGSQLEFRFATKGFEGRQQHIDKFIHTTNHDWILLLDNDMLFAPDTLTQLLAHDVPFVSGLYMRRSSAPVASVWFEPHDGTWPPKPFLHDPERGRLHEIGASGWGCMLIHRDVIMDTKPFLKGEPEIIEDDMDVWPYDARAITDLIDELKAVNTTATARDIGRKLAAEFRPLTGTRSNVGSDLRFPFFALQAGHQLMGDPDVRPGHFYSYPLNPGDFQETAQLIEVRAELAKLRDDWTAETAWMRARV